MPKPTTKPDLQESTAGNFARLKDLLRSYPQEQLNREFAGSYLNRNVRDVLAHLHHWHLLFFDWYRTGMQGQKPQMPAPGYSWQRTPELNQAIQKQYSQVALEDIEASLDGSHGEILRIIDRHSEEELFEKKRYAWTGSTSLGAYLISAGPSHYDWAIRLIRKALADI